jgi:hypothetical protein
VTAGGVNFWRRRRLPNLKTVLAAALAAPMALLALPVCAQGADPWSFEASVYAYLPTISGSTVFPQNGAGSDVSIDADTILDNLKFTFMGSFEARRGSLGLFTDVIYMDVGNSKSDYRQFTVGGIPLPGGANTHLDYDLKGWVWTLGGVWAVSAKPAATLDLLAGARLLDIEQTIGWDITGNVGAVPLPERTGSSQVGLSNWDAIVGLKGRLALGSNGKWFVPYYADIGTGESDFTWQGMGGIGYSFKWGDVVTAWRYLDYDMESGDKVESLDLNGPAISAVFRW